MTDITITVLSLTAICLIGLVINRREARANARSRLGLDS